MAKRKYEVLLYQRVFHRVIVTVDDDIDVDEVQLAKNAVTNNAYNIFTTRRGVLHRWDVKEIQNVR